MNPPVRLILSAAAAAGITVAYVATNRIMFGFDPASPAAWQGALDAFTGIAGFDPTSAVSWQLAVELTSTSGPQRFQAVWVIDEALEVAWLTLNAVSAIAAPILVTLCARGLTEDVILCVRSLARAVASHRPLAGSAGPLTPPGEAPYNGGAALARGPSSPTSPPETDLASSLHSEPPAALRGPASSPDRMSSGIPPLGGERPAPGSPDANPSDRPARIEEILRDSQIAREEVQDSVVDHESLRPLTTPAGLGSMIQQLERAVSQSNTIEIWPPITLPRLDISTPPNFVLSAGVATWVLVPADRGGPEHRKWALALVDWLADQLTVADQPADGEGAGNFIDAMRLPPPAPVLVVRETTAASPEISALTEPAAVPAGVVLHLPVSRLEEFCLHVSRHHGHLHPGMRDLLSDVFGDEAGDQTAA